jgi:hypothetical protein
MIQTRMNRVIQSFVKKTMEQTIMNLFFDTSMHLREKPNCFNEFTYIYGFDGTLPNMLLSIWLSQPSSSSNDEGAG